MSKSSQPSENRDLRHSTSNSTALSKTDFLSRRQAIFGTSAVLGLGTAFLAVKSPFFAANVVDDAFIHQLSIPQPAFAIIPVVQFGKHVWKDQPKDKTGYIDPRTYEISISIEWTGTGRATQLKAATVAPVELHEQKIDEFNIEKSPGCEAVVNPLSDETAQLEIAAPGIERGQVISATAKYLMKLYRNCPGLDKDSFPVEQAVPKEITKQYLGNSPGIESNASSVRKIAESIVEKTMHPWEKAEQFHQWVWKNIEGKLGEYTSVKTALKNRVGDCEERATVFIALCRSSGIPARMVWVPNHAWAEFCLFDESQKAYWIPSHTAAYPWFGWTGAHELVLQKGDKIFKPQTRKVERLVRDWMSWQGAKPKFKFGATVKPLPHEGEASVPGARKKLENGKWDFLDQHPENRYLRE